MAGLEGLVPGRTLARRGGFPYLRLSGFGYRVRRVAVTAVAIAGFGSALAATSVGGQAYAGVFVDPTGSRVVTVAPTGFAWRDGIRPGQDVVSVRAADSVGGWQIETRDESGNHLSVEAPIDAALAGVLPISVLSLGAGSLALLFLRTHRRWVLPSSCFALIAASVGMALQGEPELSTLILAGAAGVPAVWLAWTRPVPTRLSRPLTAGLGVFVVAWAIARLEGSTSYETLEMARRSLMVVGAAGVILDRTVLPRLNAEARMLSRPGLRDLAPVAGLSAVALLLVLVGNVSPLPIAVVLASFVLLYPGARRFAASRIGNALMADVREQAAADALEGERARIARELHDAPLQQLAGVIRRLEVKSDSLAEARQLQIVADELRAVTTDLRPPVLDDLGLGAALDFLAEETTTSGVPVVAMIRDSSEVDLRQRPPADVELAMFRIAQEAVANALQHSRAQQVRIDAEIAADSVDLVIRDDGVGLRANDMHDAVARGHMGLTSMHSRAQGIDAELSVNGDRSGTRISATWRR